MGKVINGKYIYSMEDCRCEDCLYVEARTGRCRAKECCCIEEIAEAPLHFPPDGFDRQKRSRVCRG